MNCYAEGSGSQSTGTCSRFRCGLHGNLLPTKHSQVLIEASVSNHAVASPLPTAQHQPTITAVSQNTNILHTTSSRHSNPKIPSSFAKRKPRLRSSRAVQARSTAPCSWFLHRVLRFIARTVFLAIANKVLMSMGKHRSRPHECCIPVSISRGLCFAS